MILLENILIEDDLLEAKFCCDLQKCKGACCTFYGEYGAPLLEEEIEQIEINYPKIKKYLSEKSIYYIQEKGLYEGKHNHKTTMCINNRDCVFVFYEDGIALCAFEKAFLNNEIDFRKPISCHLYPIRVRQISNNMIYYSQIDECKDAVEKGEKENIALISSLEIPLRRRFGNKWYEILKQYLENNNSK